MVRSFLITASAVFALTIHIDAWTRSGAPPVGSSAASRPPSRSSEDLGLLQGRFASDYRPPAGLSLESREADIQELRKIRLRITELEAESSANNEKAVESFSGANDAERVKNKQSVQNKIWSEHAKLQSRALVLEQRYEKKLKEVTDTIIKGDQEILQKISERMKEGNTTVSQNEIAAVIGRFSMLDLESDVRNFLTDTKNTKRDLEILELKLDQSILGSYVALKNASQLNSQGFCAAVQKMKDQADCSKFPEENIPPLGPDSVREIIKNRRSGGGH